MAAEAARGKKIARGIFLAVASVARSHRRRNHLLVGPVEKERAH